MVLKGQYLERPTLIPLAGGLVLEGLWHRGTHRPGLLVLPPPPAEGSGMDHLLAAELAFASARAGFPSLRFNYRGVGASQGDLGRRPAEWLEDAGAALGLLRENVGEGGVVVASIGASDAVALRLAGAPGVDAVALVSPRLVGPADIAGVRVVAVVVPELAEDDIARAWRSVEPQGVARTVVPASDRAFLRNLPQVGHAIARALARQGGVDLPNR